MRIRPVLGALLRKSPSGLQRAVQRWRGLEVGRHGHHSPVWFDAGDIESLLQTYQAHAWEPGGPWEHYRHAHMRLPAWFREGLDPWSQEYADQQQRLWQLITGVGRPYEAVADEQPHAWGPDPVRFPGFYQRRDPGAVVSASDHIIASGMLLRHSGLKPGDHALEYGAGFGQTALALARLGVKVDTVDISSVFCDYVTQQAQHFGVPLTAFQGQFGHNPRPGQRYKLVWFYESFHHCVDFMSVVPQLPGLLAEGGRVVLAGEPVFENEYAAVPYPWGVRLHSEVAVVMRQMRWFELGFSEAFLYELFRRSGFVGRRVDCEPSLFGRLYVFEPESSAISTEE